MAIVRHKKSGSSGSLRLLLADDNPVMLEMLVEMLRPSYVIAGAVTRGALVVPEVMATHPDIVLLDVSLGDMTGFEVARCLKKAACTAKIVFLSVHENCEFVRAGFDVGAVGHVFKSQIAVDLLTALAWVSDGGRFVPAGLATLTD